MGFFSDLMGKSASRAARDAGRIQSAYGTAGINEQRAAYGDVQGMLSPYMEAGEGALPLLQQLLSPQGQFDYLNNNPLFSASLNRLDTLTGAQQAARGRLGAGDTLEQLRQNYFATANPLLQQAFGNAFNVAGMGQNATTNLGNARLGLGNNVSDLFTQIGNASGAATIGQANARAAGASNLFGIGANIAGMFLGGGLPLGSMFGGGGGGPQSAQSYVNTFYPQ